MSITICAEKVSAKEYIDFLRRTDLGSQYPKEDFDARIETLVGSVPVSVTARNEAGMLVGAVFGITDFAYWLFVTDLGVDRAYEGQGIGRRLMCKAHEIAGGKDRIAVYLVANENAIGFYEKLGMKKSHEIMEFNHTKFTPFTVK